MVLDANIPNIFRITRHSCLESVLKFSPPTVWWKSFLKLSLILGWSFVTIGLKKTTRAFFGRDALRAYKPRPPEKCKYTVPSSAWYCPEHGCRFRWRPDGWQVRYFSVPACFTAKPEGKRGTNIKQHLTTLKNKLTRFKK